MFCFLVGFQVLDFRVSCVVSSGAVSSTDMLITLGLRTFGGFLGTLKGIYEVYIR